MKKLFTCVLLGMLSVACLLSSDAQARNSANAQARASRKMQKKQEKAMKKYLKRQQKAQRKMFKNSQKQNTLPRHR
jgi:Flp pilus assembly protein TadB